jgi:hypothetical protein
MSMIRSEKILSYKILKKVINLHFFLGLELDKIFSYFVANCSLVVSKFFWDNEEHKYP